MKSQERSDDNYRESAQLSPEIIPPAHPPLPTFETLAGGATAMDDK
jgi:hypothetical protein